MVALRQTNTLPALPLNMIAPGERVELVRIKSCGTVRRRLQELGLTAGATLRVVARHPSGQLILAVRGDSRLAIGSDIAQKIMVEQVS